ncbi:MAG: hypothetical protein IH914_11075 [candidate division Zixibacteria bacterium]|nr:hypothetical protein [candidate division Zixibacteria bacterium]
MDTVILRQGGSTVTTNRELAALLLVFDGSAKVTILDSTLQMTRGQIGGDTYVLLYGRFGNVAQFNEYGLISDDSKMPLIPPGTILETKDVLKRVEAANYDGYKLHTVITH